MISNANGHGIDNVEQAVGGGGNSGGGGTGGTTVLPSDVTVIGVSQGMYNSGDVIPAGTSLDVIIKKMLQIQVFASYSAPTLSLGSNVGASLEIGTTITPTLTPSWSQRDGGSATAYRLKRDGSLIFSNASAIAHADTSFQVSANRTYSAEVDFGAGPIKNDNMGNPSPAGAIGAGMSSSSITFYPKRKTFYVSDSSNAVPATSATVRALANTQLGLINGSTFTVNIPSGANRVIIAYPTTLRALSSVRYVEGGNVDVTDTFTPTTVNVEGAEGYATVAYRVYTYLPSVSFGSTATYLITI